MNKAAGCGGWIVAGIAVLALIGKCAGDSPADPQGLVENQPAASQQPITSRLVGSRSLNCRSSGNQSAHIVETLSRNDRVGVVSTESGWSLLNRSTPCWVSTSLLSDQWTNEPVAPVVAPRTAYSAPARRASGSSYYANCSAARAAGAAPVMRGEPGYSRRLDRDGDGVGCE